MNLYEYPKVNMDLKDLSLREQMEARLRQIDVRRYYSDKSIARMSDYALLTTFEVILMRIGHNTSFESFNEGFDAGIKVGQERMLEQINQQFGTQTQGTK